MNTHQLLQTIFNKGWRPKCIYDIGANEGKWTRSMSMTFDCDFVCFEANDKHKKPSFLSNRHKWYNAVLSHTSGLEVEFYDVIDRDPNRKGTGDSYYKEMTGIYTDLKPRTMVTETLDEIVERDALQYPDFIKIDTQGSEVDIFRGATNVLKNTGVIHVEMPILEYNRGAPKFNDYIDCLSENDFYPVALDEVHRSSDYIIQIDMCFMRRNLKKRYFPDKPGCIIL